MRGRGRLSVQIVPGPDSEEAAADAPASSELENSEGEGKRSTKGPEGGSTSQREPQPQGSSPRTRSRGVEDNLATVISRKSAAGGKPAFHRYSLFASLFDIRAAVPADEVPRLLDRQGTKLSVGSVDSSECIGISRWKRRIALCGRALVRTEARVHPLCFFSLLVGPFALSFESTCRDSERPLMLWGKILHLVSTLAYLIFAALHFFYSPLNPWPEIWRQRKNRFKLLKQHAAGANLHPALLQQLHAQGGPVRESENAEQQIEVWTLRFWMPIFDFLVLVGVIVEVTHLTAQPTRIEGWDHWAWILITAKGFRLLVPPSESVVSNFWRDSIELGMWLFVMIHLFSSLLSIISVMKVQNGRTDAWAAEALLADGGVIGCRKFYMLSWYYTATTVTSIGYGDITPANDDERMVASVVMILSQLYFAKVFADLTFLTSMYNQWTLQRHQRMTQTRSALESMNIPRQLIQRVQACQTYVWDVQKERRAKNCFEDLTTQLQEEVKLVLYSRLVIQVPFLQTVDARALRFLISRLSDQVFLPADFIICRGEIGSEMFFLREGCAGVFTCIRAPHWDDEEIKRVEKGSHFGEIALLTGQLRTAWIMARAYCLTSVLQASAIDHLMAQDPTSICALIKNFQDMLKLKASLSWSDVKQRLDREFDPDDVLRQDLYDFTCSGDDGLAPAGLITWTRYRLLLSRIQVSQLDQKLLWALLDEEQCGSVSFEHFVYTVYGHLPEESGSESDGAGNSHSLRSAKSSRSFRAPAIDVYERKDSSASCRPKPSTSTRSGRLRVGATRRRKPAGAAIEGDVGLVQRLSVLEEKIDLLLGGGSGSDQGASLAVPRLRQNSLR
mmetsp:Transcript_35091/g.80832  ORF Transcript_35091/g.80832 Transcript_35091/m.80832 type:complete len:844 (-) Transcript_35091:40-2571(-)